VYGPPPDPHQVLAPVAFADAPLPWVACVLVGLGVAWVGRRRDAGVIVGLVVALTTPAAWYLPTFVLGSFPTIDKAGSLAFYLDGVHTRMFDLADPGMRLIGIHVGHLWITALFDLVLEPFAAMNLQGLMNLALGWWAATALFRAWTGHRAVALLLAFPFAMNLHQFRDLNWYTIEKTSIYWLPLYAWALTRAAARHPFSGAVQSPRRVDLLLPGAAAFGAFFVNIYVGLLCALLGALSLGLRDRRLALAAALSGLPVLPLLAWQWGLMHGDTALASPERFLSERAALDVVELWPPLWNRLEAWRALNLVALGLAVVGARRAPALWVGAGVAFLLALGPTHNPLYRVLFEVVPGFWRVAKPESFFHLTWLLLLGVAALELARRAPGPRVLAGLALLFAVGWGVGVRSHPVYPPLTEPGETSLAPDWERAVPGFAPSAPGPDRSPPTEPR